MKKLIPILVNYADTEENYGLLGPQVAATIIQDNSDYECVVVAVGHNFDKDIVKKNIVRLACGDRPIIGFSNLGGRPELWALAKELKAEGIITILGGPQADVDYSGEIGWEKHHHRFPGVRDNFSFALQGPAEQLIPFLNSQEKKEPEKIYGALFIGNGKCQMNEQNRWNADFLAKVNWENLYHLDSSGLKPVSISNAQVVQQIGCPYAAKEVKVSLDYPTNLKDTSFSKKGKISFNLHGCSFCDVARDKGFGGNLPLESVLMQITNLPNDAEGRKIPFELINEAPLPTLPNLLLTIKQQGINISQLNLVSRADWLVIGEENIRASLNLAKTMEVRIFLSAAGFESFSNSILRNLNKGYSVDTNLSAIKLIRQLKEEFPENWFYSTDEGASHGFIHPTPWDSAETEREMNSVIFAYGLNQDILPPMSTPLIIHHACGLGDWARELERNEGLTLKRMASVIEWW
ncbi:MAG: hypothetical protein U9R04_03575 [Chloroflexota bacterium]|nr:hypothetical protein [Chloroflexota bacterium]